MTQAMHRVLVIEDDRDIAQVLTLLFEANGFRVVTAGGCALGVRQAQSQRPDICIVDLGLPDRDGLNFIQQTRRWSSVPVIVLTARSDRADRLAAFDAGADDYVMKPFCSPELLARVRAILRRITRADEPAPMLRIGAITVDLAKRRTRNLHDEEARLTPLEHRLLECLVRNAGRVVTHQQLMREVWGPHQADVRAVRVCVGTLRRKLECNPALPQHLLTEPGIGYRLETSSAAMPAFAAEPLPQVV